MISRKRSRPASNAWRTVKRGETLKSLARKHGTTAEILAQINNIPVDTVLSAGGKIKVS